MIHHVGFAKLDTIYKNSFTSPVIYNYYMKIFMLQNIMSASKPFKTLDPKKNKVVRYFIFYRYGQMVIMFCTSVVELGPLM